MDTQLHDQLKRLHSELQQIHSVNAEERKLLRELLADIRNLTDGAKEDQAGAYDRLGEGLREGVELFEASHPTATMLMGQVIDTLAKMGI